MLKIVLFFLDYALVTLPLLGLLIYAILRWRGAATRRNLIISFGLVPFPLLLVTYVLSALIINGPHGRFDFLTYVELTVRAYPVHVALFGASLIMLRRRASLKAFLMVLALAYVAAAAWQFFSPFTS